MLLGCTMLTGIPSVALAQGAPATAQPGAAAQQQVAPAPSATPVERTIRSLRVEGSQRIEPDTALSYTKLRIGQPYTNESLDQAIKDLYASDLFADVTVAGAETGDIVLRVFEVIHLSWYFLIQFQFW